MNPNVLRLHVVSLPHTQTTEEFSSCAYTQKVVKFCRMMKDRGHIVYLYSGEQNTTPCDRHFECISEERRKQAVARVAHYTQAGWNPDLDAWEIFNRAALGGIQMHHQHGDFVCLIGATGHKPIADQLPHPAHLCVEFGIGYSGCFAKYRVYESEAWRHMCYGQDAPDRREVMAWRGSPDHTVIPNYFDPSDFKFKRKKGDYVLYLGRMTMLKGIHIAAEAARRAGAILVTAGSGDALSGVLHHGEVGPRKRRKLLAEARAVLMPTQYVEPFGGVAVEAMLSGTPVITSDWGAFTETVAHGVSGFRCNSLDEYVEAIWQAPSLRPDAVRAHAMRYTLPQVAPLYERYLRRIRRMAQG